MEILTLTGGLGAEILGADIRRAGDFEAIFEAFVKHSVIVLRGQDCAPEDHLAFARRFGPVNINRFFRPVEGYPEIATVLKEKDQKQAIGEGWHTDHSYDEMPDYIKTRILAVQEKAGFLPNVFLVLTHRPDEFRAFASSCNRPLV